MTEENLRRALQTSMGSWSVFFTRPISLVFLTATVVSVVIAVRRLRTESKSRQP